MSKRKIQTIIIALIVLVLIGVCVWRLVYIVRLEQNENVYEQLREIVAVDIETPESEVGGEHSSPTSDSEETSEQNNAEQNETEQDIYSQMDLPTLQEVNKDIYAWITVNGSKVNYPILQNEVDNYYLKRCINGRNGLPGCIYTNSCSAKDFSSWNTVIYGHNMINGTMFGSLKVSSKWDEEMEYIDITTNTQKLRYRVYAVTEFSNAYLPAAYNEASDADREKFLKDLKEAAQNAGYLRSDMEVSAEDKLVTLSTCIKTKDEKRLLVVGVLE